MRPSGGERLQYQADALGHFMIAADVNDAPLKFLLDTGATLVALSPTDAAAANINAADLKFDKTVQTGNGPASAAATRLRRVRVNGLEVDDVDAVVIQNLKQSVLGMSFLRRLKDFSVRDGTLTMEW
jgi:aspartyl protease family protein